MDAGEQTTGTRDEHYNLVSVLYHTLQGTDTCDRYALDAEEEGREQLARFFRQAQQSHAQIAEQVKALLDECCEDLRPKAPSRAPAACRGAG